MRNLAVANGLPPDMLPDLGRYQAIENTLVDRLDGGTLPKSQCGPGGTQRGAQPGRSASRPRT